MVSSSRTAVISINKPLFARIVSYLHADKKSLCSLCLASESLNGIASSILYEKICIWSRPDVEALEQLTCEGSVLSTPTKGQPRCALSSSCLPRNSSFVEEFEVVALIFPGANQLAITRSLEAVLLKYGNLRSFTWQPRFCDDKLALSIMRLLPRLSGLKRLSIKIPFILPDIPKAASLSKPVHNLETIAEEDEEENQGEDDDVSVAESHRESNKEGPVDSDANTENAEPYEYKPLEDDIEGALMPHSILPCSIPPTELRLLQSLVLASPSSEVLTPLPEVLRSLERPILALILEGNCGPVTPRTLITLLPALQGVGHFGLGVTYSVKYEDLIPFLDGLPKLHKLEIFHYHQLYKRTSPMAHLRLLKSLKVRHKHTTSRKEAVNMCVWIRRMISYSSIEELEMECENSGLDECPSRGPGHGIRYNGLIEHLIAHHKASLRVLNMPGAYVGMQAMRRLFGTHEGQTGCESLEEVHVSVRRPVFDALPDLIGSLHRLQSIRLDIVNLKRRVKPQVNKSILREGKSSLRDVLVNGQGYRGEWVADLCYDEANGERLRLEAIFQVSEIS